MSKKTRKEDDPVYTRDATYSNCPNVSRSPVYHHDCGNLVAACSRNILLNSDSATSLQTAWNFGRLCERCFRGFRLPAAAAKGRKR